MVRRVKGQLLLNRSLVHILRTDLSPQIVGHRKEVIFPKLNHETLSDRLGQAQWKGVFTVPRQLRSLIEFSDGKLLWEYDFRLTCWRIWGILSLIRSLVKERGSLVAMQFQNEVASTEWFFLIDLYLSRDGSINRVRWICIVKNDNHAAVIEGFKVALQLSHGIGLRAQAN